MVRGIGFQRMAGAGEILAFLEQKAAQAEAVELLVARKVGRRDVVELPEGGLPALLPSLVKSEAE